MNPHPLALKTRKPGDDSRFHLLRRRKETAAQWLIAVGGVGVVCAMVLLLLYLLWVVMPLFSTPQGDAVGTAQLQDDAQGSPLLIIDERGDAGMLIDREGALSAFRLPGLESLAPLRLVPEAAPPVSALTRDVRGSRLRAAGTAEGRVLLFEPGFNRPPFNPAQDKGPRPIDPELAFPFGDTPRFFSRAPIHALALADQAERVVIAALAGADPAARELVVEWAGKQTNMLSGEITLETQLERRDLDFAATTIAIDGDQRWVYLGDRSGSVHRFTLPALEPAGQLVIGAAPVTALAMLAGGTSVLIGDTNGAIYQAFPLRDDAGSYELQLVRSFPAMAAAIESILPESRRRGFAALDAQGHAALYHSTTGQQLLTITPPGLSRQAASGSPGMSAALAPRGDQLLLIDGSGKAQSFAIDNPHPEVSFETLWKDVWYENYPAPDRVWQSTASNASFEAKFSLAPLAFGTLKASLYAMIFAVPVALLGATYTAVFMAPALRRKIKPTIELMAALPTVILGFLAGLWLAPFIENELAGLFAMVLIVPLGLLVFAFAWSRPAVQRHFRGLRGWEPLLLLPVMIALTVLALWLAPPLQQLLFGGDLRDWLSQEAGISYDQRNAIVVGIAMGFSVIPIIFSIAEDALYAVPGSLTDGSLALGATRWQSLVRIVLPTASPGIFSGLMIGLGRAVGETMIVLMATGNTPIMNWSLFEGMRTLAANIAIEMPESAVASTHFRVLFLSALVLFVFTFVVNTIAELIRQRLRDRYASL